MKVLFAVNNDNISDAIVKKYQEKYREILSYKNVYYFNAILKELQKDKTYDRVIISEDLEPFANNNYDTIDKFLFEKLDNISDEAEDTNGNNTDVIVICTDRRTKSDEMLLKLFSIGVYSAIVGQDRSVDEVCNLINKPRTKREAKLYYKIEADTASYQVESENTVSEAEIQNILAHYKRLGKNQDKYVDSFNNIISQYTDVQLKIIIKYLPINVKAVLEEKSQKYQELVTFRVKDIKEKVDPTKTTYTGNKFEDLSKKFNSSKLSRPVVVPTGVNSRQVKKLIEEQIEDEKNDNLDVIDFQAVEQQTDEQKMKRGRGRPKKNIISQEENKPKRGRGRPKKNIDDEESQEDTPIDLFNLDDDEDIKEPDSNVVKTQEDIPIDLFNLDDDEEYSNDKQEKEDSVDLFSLNNDDESEEKQQFSSRRDTLNDISQTNFNSSTSNLSKLLTKDKKVVAFVGTTKNGTSFVINNLAELLSSMGISTAILDMTKTKNAYYIYTKNEETLRKTAENSIYKLKSGITDGIKQNKNLTIYTSVPGEDKDYSQAEEILSTLVQKYSIVLIDCDFETPVEYFDKAQEIYLIQTMDVLTIQPLTAFLRNLKSKNILKQEKLKVVINKAQKVNGLTPDILIRGISCYNDPGMSFMTELFNKNLINYCTIPFEMQNYSKYLGTLVNCQISLNGYTKTFMNALKELANMVYPLINRQTYTPRGDRYKDNFSEEVNDTLNKMKKNYK